MFFNLAANRESFGKLLVLSSGAVYDRRHPVPLVTEDSFGLRMPADDYGFSKYICGQFIEASENLYDLRLFGVFGPNEDWEIRFLSNACCRAVWDLPIVIRQNVFFDFMDIADLGGVVEAFVEMTPRYHSYNVCTGRAIDLVTLAAKIVHASGKDLPVIVKEPGLGAEYSGGNRRLLGELPGFGFREVDHSIRNLYRWYFEHKTTIDPARLNFDA
jgi:GDP-L-fucose synthase